MRALDVCAFVHSYVRSRVRMGVCVRHHHSPQLRKIKGKHGCVYVCPASSLYRRQLLVCVCMYGNITECLQLHKSVILLLIMKYFVLKILSYSHTTTPCGHLSKLFDLSFRFLMQRPCILANFIVSTSAMIPHIHLHTDAFASTFSCMHTPTFLHT